MLDSGFVSVSPDFDFLCHASKVILGLFVFATWG